MSWHKEIAYIFLCIISLKSIAANKYNVSLTEMATCKEYHIGGRGYMYSEFFHVHNMDNNNIADDEHLHLKFYVQTSMDAHILLSVNDRPRLMDRVYEIVIGAGGNTFSTIRTSMGRRRVDTNQDAHILSIFDPTPIEIVQKKDGVLLVYIPGFKETPLLNYTDIAPLQINYISFSAFGSVGARWFYDCKFDGYGNEIEEEVRPQTALQQLLANVSINAANKSIPLELKDVICSLNIIGVSYKQEASILTTRMVLTMSWNDNRLVWQPQDFNGLRVIMHPDLKIWTPELLVFNGALNTFRNLKINWQLRLDSFGGVTMTTDIAELHTWCPNNAHNWPRDNLQCQLVIGLNDFDAQSTAPLRLTFEKQMFTESVAVASEWQFVQLSVGSVANDIFARLNEHGMQQVMEGDLSIYLQIKRNSGFYQNVYSVPWLTCQILLLLSFTMRGYRRGALLLLVLLVMALGLMYLTKHAPHYYIPKIMLAYQHLMRLTVAAYWLHIVIMWLQLYPPRQKPHRCLMAIVNCSPLRLMLCMRFTDATEFVSIQEHPWQELAKILNNTCFIVFNVLFVLCDVFLLLK